MLVGKRHAGLSPPGFSLPGQPSGPASPVPTCCAAGRPVLINFFASWCIPCLAKRRADAAARAEHRDLGIAYKDRPAPPRRSSSARRSLRAHRTATSQAAWRSISASTACRKAILSTAPGGPLALGRCAHRGLGRGAARALAAEIRLMVRALLAAAFLALATHAFAVSSPAELMADPAQESRAEAIGHQLRCMVCQNEMRRGERGRPRAGSPPDHSHQRRGGRQRPVDRRLDDRPLRRLRPAPPAVQRRYRRTLGRAGPGAAGRLRGVLLSRRRRAAPAQSLSDEERRRLAELLKP